MVGVYVTVNTYSVSRAVCSQFTCEPPRCGLLFQNGKGVVRKGRKSVRWFDAHDEISVGNILARVMVWIRNGN